MIIAALLAAALMQVRETTVKPVIDGWAEPSVWSRVPPVPVGDAVCRALWDREALYVYLESLRAVEIVINTSNVFSERLTHLDRRYVLDSALLNGTTTTGVEYAQADERREIKLPWSALGGMNGRISMRLGAWSGELRLLAANNAAIPIWEPAPQAMRRGTVFFSDDFGPASRGELLRNIVSGSEYATGYRPAKWVQIDQHPWDDPRRGLWILPEKDSVLVQAGRSEPSWLFIGKPLPASAVNYDIEFLLRRAGNDPIAFILGASRPDAKHDGVDIEFETQVPDSDRTTTNVYYRGALGEGVAADQAFTAHWVPHRIEVRRTRVQWLIADRVIAEGDVSLLRPGGFFGFCHRGERDTQYDDFSIRIIGRGQ